MKCPFCGENLYRSELIPERTKAALDEYVFHRRQPGDFLLSVLANNLKGAFQAADDANLSALPAIVSYMHNHMPFQCCGSPGKVQQWLLSQEDQHR